MGDGLDDGGGGDGGSPLPTPDSNRLLEASGDGIYALDAAGRFTYTNGAHEELTGYASPELLGEHVSSVVRDRDLERIEAVVRELLADGDRDHALVEHDQVRKDGSVVPTEIHLSLLLGDDGEFEGTTGVVRDVGERRRREHELEEYETIVETVPDGVLVIDEDGLIVDANRTAGWLFDREEADLVGQPFDRFLELPGNEESLEDRYTDLLGSLFIAEAIGEQARFEYEHEVDGEPRVFETNFALRPADDGEFRGTIGMVRDITERREHERALERHETIIEASGDPVYALDDRGRFEFVNRAMADVLGYDRSELLGEHFTLVSAEADVSRGTEVIRGLLSGGDRRSETFEVTLVSRDGERIPAEAHIALLNDPGQDFRGTAGIVRDISERKARERTITRLHDATREFMAVETAGEIADLVIEATTEVLEFPFTAVMLWDEEIDALRVVADTPEARARTLSPPRVMERGEGVCGTVYATGEPAIIHDRLDSQHTIVQEDTGVRSACVIPLGEHGVYVISSDEPNVFEERDVDIASLLATNAEAALDRSARETELRRRERELAGQNQRLDRFASMVSHDLRNPLNVATGRIQIARRESDSEHLERAEGALRRMADIVEDVLLLAREDADVLDRETVALADCVREAWKSIDAPAACLSVDVADRALSADRSQLQRLLENHLRNAVDHAGPDVEVTVGTLPSGFYVEDDGPGIPPEERDRVFEFGRTTGGTGLGLAIVAEIADAHGWDLAAVEGSAGGARFEVTGVDWVDDP